MTLTYEEFKTDLLKKASPELHKDLASIFKLDLEEIMEEHIREEYALYLERMDSKLA